MDIVTSDLAAGVARADAVHPADEGDNMPSLLQDVHTIAQEAQKQTQELHLVHQAISECCDHIADSHCCDKIVTALEALTAQLKRIADVVNPVATDLTLRFEENEMAKVKVKMKAGKGMKADGGTVNWSAASSSGGLVFVPLDSSGNELPPPNVADVTSTLTLDDPSKVAVAKNDELSYTLSKAAGVTGEVNLAASLAYNAGSPGPFGATLKLILDVAQAADLIIKFTPA